MLVITGLNYVTDSFRYLMPCNFDVSLVTDNISVFS